MSHGEVVGAHHGPVINPLMDGRLFTSLHENPLPGYPRLATIPNL
jgi:hypothetical protein